MSQRFVARSARLLEAGAREALCVPLGAGLSGAAAVTPVFLSRDEQLVFRAFGRPADRSELETRLRGIGWETEDAAYLDEVISRLRGAGLLHELGKVRGSIAAGGDPAKRLEGGPADHAAKENSLLGMPSVSVAWVTAGRPESLARSLRTYLAHIDHPDAEPIRIFHDRAAPEIIAATRRVVGEIIEETGRPVRLLETEDRRRFADALAEVLRARVERSILETGILGPPEGRNRPHSVGAVENWHLLASQNRIAVCSDDDIFFPVVRRADSQVGAISLSAIHDPQSVRFYSSYADLEGDSEALEFSVDVHRQALVGLPEVAEILDLSELSPDLATAAPRLRPAVTCSGMAGDTGMSTPSFRLFLSGEDRAALVKNRRTFAQALRTRLVIRHSDALTYSSGLQFMTPHVAFDTRLPLVPFPPIGRGGDSVFRCLLSVTCPELLAVHLPVAVQHSPPESRSVSSEAYRDVEPRAGDLLVAILAAIQQERTPPRGHRAVGLRMQSIAEGPEGAFRRRIAEIWIEAMNARRVRGGALLERHGFEPRFWSEAFQEHLDGVAELVTSVDWAPRDLEDPIEQPTSAVEQAWRAFRDYLCSYAELIAEWPTIVAAAREVAAGDSADSCTTGSPADGGGR